MTTIILKTNIKQKYPCYLHMLWSVAASNALMLASVSDSPSPLKEVRGDGGTTLYDKDSSSIARVWYEFHSRLTGRNTEEDVRQILKMTAKKVATLFKSDFHIEDRVTEGPAWGWLGRVLAMRIDGGHRMITLLEPYSEGTLSSCLDKKFSLVNRLGELAIEFIAVVAKPHPVDTSINALVRICTSRMPSERDTLIATHFVTRLSTLKDEVRGFDIWAALYPKICPETESDSKDRRTVDQFLKAVEQYVSWCRRNEAERGWLLRSQDVRIISSTLPRAHAAEISARSREGERIIACDEEGPLALAERFFSKNHHFTRPPQIVDHGPFFTFVSIKDKALSFENWYNFWRKSGYNLESPQLNILMQTLKAGLGLKKMPDWKAFHRGEWGFQEGEIVALHPVRWLTLDPLQFDHELWQLCDCQPEVFEVLSHALEFNVCEPYIRLMAKLTEFLTSTEEMSSLRDPLYLTWRDHLYALRETLRETIAGSGVMDEGTLQRYLILVALSLKNTEFFPHPLWPTIGECNKYLSTLPSTTISLERVAKSLGRMSGDSAAAGGSAAAGRE